ncbi:MAG: hypothetical protein HYX87_08630 [Chloroflexi bacterium]|nr:hypothetical protein [Chloroflexota bacterium]
MRIYNTFIVAAALVFSAITVVMAAYHVADLDSYYIAYTIALLVLALLFVSFSPRGRRALSLVSLAAFGGFIIVVALKVAGVLFGKQP